MSTNNNISPYSENHVEPVNGSSSDNNNNSKKLDGSSSSSAPANVVTYEDLVRNRDLFWEKLYALHGETKETLKLPTLGGGILDLHQLFIKVTARGGYQKVIQDRKWKEVVVSLNFPPTLTSASYAVRKIYISYLSQLEHEYYVPKQDDIAMNDDNEMPNPEDGIDKPPVIGGMVRGYIDGKFESGYLVTVKIGSEEMQGVLYHVAGTSLPQPTMGTFQAPPGFPAPSAAPALPAPPGFSAHQPSSAVATPSSSQRRRSKKKSKVALVDDQKPKCHRSGYNFFFREQHARLRPEFAGREREITSAIGNMWSNLPEAEKQVYQDQGFQDSLRYRSEMSEYKSALESGAASASGSAPQ